MTVFPYIPLWEEWPSLPCLPLSFSTCRTFH